MSSEWAPEEFKPSHLKRNLILLLILCSAVIAVALKLTVLSPSAPVLYSKPEWGLSVEVPESYKKTTEENDNGLIVRFDEQDKKAILVVRAQVLSSATILENYAAEVKSSLQQTSSAAGGVFTIVSENPRQVAGVSAWELIGTVFSPYYNETAKIKVASLVSDTHRYSIYCTAVYQSDFAELDPTFESFIQSFRLI